VFCFFTNYITLKILNRVASVKSVDSYQEVAYNISNSNRGYIFLISSAKFIFLGITVSFNIDYCAGYLASLFQLGNHQLEASRSYGFYVLGVLISSAIIFCLFYWRLRKTAMSQDYKNISIFSTVFAGSYALSFLVIFCTMIAALAGDGSILNT